MTWAEEIDLPLGVVGRLGWKVAEPLVRWGLTASLKRLAKGVLDGSLVAGATATGDDHRSRCVTDPDGLGAPRAATATTAPQIDDRVRCAWANSTPDYVGYHDDEWGVPPARR